MSLLIITLFGYLTFFSPSHFANDVLYSVGQKTDSLQYKTITFTKSAHPCAHCTVEVVFSYPRILEAGNTLVRDSINERIQRFINNPVYTGKKSKTPQQIFKKLVGDYRSLVKKFPNYPHGKWYLKRTARIIYQTNKYVSILIDENMFTGGAHPLHTRFYRSVDYQNGRKIKLRNIIKRNKMDSLLRISEQLFRKVRSLSPDSSLKKAGFWFKNGRFHLNNNFALTSKGIVFYFNPYKIAPYAWGPTQIKIPWSKLKGIVQNYYR